MDPTAHFIVCGLGVGPCIWTGNCFLLRHVDSDGPIVRVAGAWWWWSVVYHFRSLSNLIDIKVEVDWTESWWLDSFCDERSSVIAFCSLNLSTSSARKDLNYWTLDLRDLAQLVALKICLWLAGLGISFVEQLTCLINFGLRHSLTALLTHPWLAVIG